jgi:hypothetical protein
MAMVTVVAMVTVARSTQTPIALTQAAAQEAGPYRAASASHIGDTE